MEKHEDALEKFREDFNTHVLNDKIMYNRMYKMVRRFEMQALTWSKLAKIAGGFFALLEVINTVLNLLQHTGTIK